MSNIEWTDATWNPMVGCFKVSAGCQHCYAIRDAHRLARNPHPAIAAAYHGLTTGQGSRVNWSGDIRFLRQRLFAPLHWTSPRRVFVNSMSDCFYEAVPPEYLMGLWAVMAHTPQHTYQILTKRPARMQGHCQALASTPSRTTWTLEAVAEYFDVLLPAHWHDRLPVPCAVILPNVWLGVSVEDADTADFRIPLLQATPAALRFLSCEPLLGPLPDLDLQGIGWVIVGGESGPGARPMCPSWARLVIDQCRAASVPVFYKQGGSHLACDHSKKGGCLACQDPDLRIREYPPLPQPYRNI